jgi:hypothetical protein
MRLGLIIAAIGVATIGWSVSAQTTDDPAADRYLAELARQCPQSKLQFLSPAQFRDGLDDFIAGLTQEQQDQMRHTEVARCSSNAQGAGCVDDADVTTADQLDLTSDLVSSICGKFLRCRSQGDCDQAR